MRYSFYTKRKNYIINKLEKELKYIGSKVRFVEEIIDKSLNIMNVAEEKIVKELEKRKYDKDLKETNNDEENENKNKHGYEYLLRLQVRTFTSDKVKELKDDIISLKHKLDYAKSLTEKQMWLNDLKEFEDEYVKWLKIMQTQKNKTVSKKK